MRRGIPKEQSQEWRRAGFLRDSKCIVDPTASLNPLQGRSLIYGWILFQELQGNAPNHYKYCRC